MRTVYLLFISACFLSTFVYAQTEKIQKYCDYKSSDEIVITSKVKDEKKYLGKFVTFRAEFHKRMETLAGVKLALPKLVIYQNLDTGYDNLLKKLGFKDPKACFKKLNDLISESPESAFDIHQSLAEAAFPFDDYDLISAFESGKTSATDFINAVKSLIKSWKDKIEKRNVFCETPISCESQWNASAQSTAFYSHTSKMFIVGKKYAEADLKDSQVVMGHEMGHHYISQVLGKALVELVNITPIDEVLADYFITAYMNDPDLAGVRNMSLFAHADTIVDSVPLEMKSYANGNPLRYILWSTRTGTSDKLAFDRAVFKTLSQWKNMNFLTYNKYKRESVLSMLRDFLEDLSGLLDPQTKQLLSDKRAQTGI